jgi:peptidoglycan-associated lipoprotein
MPGEILVKFKSGVQEDRIRRFHSIRGVIQESRSALTQVRQLKLPDGLSVEKAIEQYRTNPDVEYAEPNYIRRPMATPSDPSLIVQWGLQNTGQPLNGTSPPLKGISGADIEALQAWNIVTGSPNMIVAVIDSGLDYTHPEFSSNIWTNPGEDSWSSPQDPTTGDKADSDGNGRVDDWKGWNFVGNRVCTRSPQGGCNCTPDDPVGNNNPMDDYGHGTAAAGVIAAQGNNNEGVAGILWTAKIMPLKFMDAVGCGFVNDEIHAIDYAVQNGARIITANFGEAPFSQLEYEAISRARDAGILFVAPAGNSRSDNDVSPVYPASYDLPNVISVAASDYKDHLAFFSNFGMKTVHLAAPGDCIYTTMPTGSFTLLSQTNLPCTGSDFLPDYDYNSGTSFAASFVAGIAGLLLIQDPSLTPEDLKAIMISTTDPNPYFKGNVMSSGRVNAYRALTRDLGASFSGGTEGRVGCGGVDLIGGDGPVSPGTAAVLVLVIVSPLLLVSRVVRKRLLDLRGAVFFFIIFALLLAIQWMIAAGDAQAQEDTQMTHQLTLKLGFHLYRSSEYFNANDQFFDQNDLTSLARELEYDYLWFSPSTLSLAVGYFGGRTDFKNICCSQVEFTNRYAMATLKFRIKPVKLKPFEFYFGPGVGLNHFERKITVSNGSDNFSQRVFDLHLVAGVQVRLNTRLSFILESRYSTANIKHADALDDDLNIGGLTTFAGVAWQYPDLRHFFSSGTAAPSEMKAGVAPAEVAEERVIPPVEKPLEERPEPEEKVAVGEVPMAEAGLQEIHFGYDDWIIAEEARSILEKDARWLQAHPDVNVVLEGYCDERGTNEYNLALGARRAETVKRVLVTFGVSENRLSVISYGEERPQCPESTEECYAKNRRVQFTTR